MRRLIRRLVLWAMPELQSTPQQHIYVIGDPFGVDPRRRLEAAKRVVQEPN
jgi:hypothetical protein